MPGKPLRIALVSSYEGSGGAGAAAHRLWQGLCARPDVYVRRFVEHREIADSDAVLFSEGGRFNRISSDVAGWLDCSDSNAWRRWRQRCSLSNLLKHVRWTKPDVINLHGFNQWTQPGLARDAVLKLAEIAPVVWTLHDLWPLTGTCDFVGASAPEAVSHGATSREGKQLASLGRKLVWAGPSKWITELARAAYENCPCVTIPYGVDTTAFHPMERHAARTFWSVPDDALVIGAVAYRLHDPRKGIATLIEAAAGLERQVMLLLAGHEDVPLPRPAGVDVRVVGPISDERLLRALYAAADVVAVPSIEDNLPNVMLESLACGRPVAGSAVGGIPDAVRPGATGWLAPAGDVAAWRAMLTEALAAVDAEAGAWHARCRAVAEAEYSLAAQASAYAECFRGKGVAG